MSRQEYVKKKKSAAKRPVQASARKPVKRKKKKSAARTVLLALGSFLVVVIAGGVILFFVYFGGLNTKPLEGDDEQLGIPSNFSSLVGPTEVKNIALFGLDGKSDQTRSDCIVIVSIDPKLKKVKMVSVMRDSYVDINGSTDKIGHAYAYGGPELAVRTLNQNFNLDIRDYVTVNFESMADVIDAVGGVTLEITQAEMNSANRNIEEISNDPDYLINYGTVHMSGAQAVGYARIRNLDGDQERTARQRKVLTALIEEAMQMETRALPGLAQKVIPMVTATSMDYLDIASYLTLLSSDLTVEQAVIPQTYSDQSIGGVYYCVYDLDEASEIIHDFFYRDIHPDKRDELNNSASASSGTDLAEAAA